jgi:large subunit ribosomal protein L25
METVRIRAQSRPRIGTRFARALRKSGNLPAILYGHGLDPVAMSLPLHDLQVALDHGARTLEVDLDGKEEQCLIKEVQYDHLQATPMHVDLMRVYRDEHVRVEVGIELKGIPAGVHDGGFLDQVMAKLPIDCLVTGIPQTLHPVVTHLALGDALYVRDLQLPPGVVALADPDERVAVVRLAAAHRAEAQEAPPEGAEPTQPEIIGRAHKEEEEAG